MKQNNKKEIGTTKKFFEISTNKNWAQDVITGEFVNIKTGKRIRFNIVPK